MNILNTRLLSKPSFTKEEAHIAETLRVSAKKIFESEGCLGNIAFVMENEQAKFFDMSRLDGEQMNTVVSKLAIQNHLVIRMGEAWVKEAQSIDDMNINIPVKDQHGAYDVAIQTVYLDGVAYFWQSKINRIGNVTLLEEWIFFGPVHGGKMALFPEISSN